MEKYTIGEWTVDPVACTLSSQNNSKSIEPKCMELLILLIKAKGEVVSRADIMDNIWQGRYVTDHVLNNLVASLRKHLDRNSNTTYIKTRPKRGYQLVVEPHTLSEQIPKQPTYNSPVTTTPIPPVAQHKTRSVRILFLAAAVLIMFGALYLFVLPTNNSQEKPSLAVVPFDVFDSQQQTEHFTNGLVEETIHQLSSNSALNVASRSSSFALVGTPLDSKEIAQKLGADYLLEGSVRTENQLLRVTTRLINGETGNQLWSRAFTANQNAILKSQSDISVALTQTILDSLQSAQTLQELEQNAIPHEAILHVLRGRKLNKQGSMDAYMKAVDEFQMAAMIAPHYLDAQIDLALNYLILGQERKMDSSDANRLAYEAIERALEISPAHAKTLSVKATYHLNKGEHALAERDYREALSYDPDLYIAVINYANLLRIQHRYDESLPLYKHAKFLAPRSSPANWAIGNILISVGQLQEAQQQYQSCIELLPDYEGCYAGLAYVQRLNSKDALADTTLQSYSEMTDSTQYWPRIITAWHHLWKNDLRESQAMYDDIVADFGINFEGVDSATLLMWQQGQLDSWMTQLQQADNESAQIIAALAHANYLGQQCDKSIPLLNEFMSREPKTFDHVGVMANAISYRSALAYCYKVSGNDAAFKSTMRILSQTLSSLLDNADEAPGLLFVKGQYDILSGNYANLAQTVGKIQSKNPMLGDMIKRDPIYQSVQSLTLLTE